MEYLIAFFIGVLIFRFLKNSIGSLASVPPEIDPTDVLETSQSFLCKACGTELTVKLQSVVANEPPKHCKEEMTPIENWRFQDIEFDSFDYFKKDGIEYKIDRYDKDHIIHRVEWNQF